jgi:hypothetical protein
VGKDDILLWRREGPTPTRVSMFISMPPAGRIEKFKNVAYCSKGMSIESANLSKEGQLFSVRTLNGFL